MDGQEVSARLNKAGTRVVCRDLSCGFQFAQFSFPPRRYPGRIPEVEFGPGWVLGDDGIWRMSRRAYNRLRQGHPPTFRRDPRLPSIRRHPCRSQGPDEPFPGHRLRYRPRNYSKTATPPVRVVCPKCGGEQTIDSEVMTHDP